MAEKKTKKPETDAAPVKSGGGLIGSVLTAAVAGAAAFAAIYFLPQKNPPQADGGTGEEEAAAYSGQTHELEEVVVETTFVALSPMVVSVGRDDGLRHLKIGLSFEVAVDQAALLSEQEPKLRDVFMSYLRAVEGQDLEDPAFMARLRAQLERRAATVLGESFYLKLLITDFILT
ncbi:MAG: flagellar basal body-associated FliL family protein [Parvularculaceae bacterium]